jgi:SAM-dependent methyltransferase
VPFACGANKTFAARKPFAERYQQRLVGQGLGTFMRVNRMFGQPVLCYEFGAPSEAGLRRPTLSGHEPPMAIEPVGDGPALQSLFEHIQSTWQHLGESDPFWSVVSGDRFRQNVLDDAARRDFYENGRDDVHRLFATLARAGVDPAPLRSCLEYGCGLGRVTRWLAPRFAGVHAYDISAAHLRGADEYLRAQGLDNVTLHQVHSVAQLDDLPRVDLVFSVIVLQHNPPPIIRAIVQKLLRALNPGGIAFFQVPTYREDYRFSLADYLGNEGTRKDMEMHVLPQREIFALARAEGAELLEVQEDGCTGMRPGEVSNTFLMRKR